MGKMELGLFVSLLIILLSLELGICDVATNTSLRCIERERTALLSFKATLLYPFSDNTLLPSWNSSSRDCCAWKSVTCHNITGHVISLDLTRGNTPHESPFRAERVDSSLLELKHLTYLDLSRIDFKFNKFPTYLGSLKQLQYLNLSRTYFSGVVPQNLGNISNLRTLDLSTGGVDLKVDDLIWASRLSSLEHLDMSGVDLSMAKHVFEVLKTLPSLHYLSLPRSGLDSRHLPYSCTNSTLHANLQHLDLRNNYYDGEFPCFLSNTTSLRFLDLSYNFLHGPIPPSIGNLSLLTHLDISSNNLSGEIPTSLGELSNLKRIQLSFNGFETTLSEAHFAKLSKLQELYANSNKMIKFDVGYDWVPPFQLKYFSLQSSKIGGQFPQWLQTQKALFLLDLSNCSITGTLPSWLHSMDSLNQLDLSHNNISGPVPELSPSTLFLDLSYNMITHLPTHTRSISFLFLARNLINGSIPDSVCQMRRLFMLDLSRNNFTGNLPNCWPSLRGLMFASLSYNEFTGVIPESIGGASSLMRLRLNDNRLTGQLPSTLINCWSLELLDVGGNNLSGKLPQWMGTFFSLKFLKLRDNDFSGTIPREMCQLSELQVLDIANNNLTGNIPHCFGNFSAMLLNSEHGISTILFGAKMLSDSLIQVVKGVELEYTKNYKYLVNLDLSRNQLVGEIPWEITKLTGLLGLNVSHNHLEGQIPAKIGDMNSLESLDLSNNDLVGEIPESLSNLNFLSYLNLSNNGLYGPIPTGRQLQTFNDPSIYDGNPHLCGAPLQRKCTTPTSNRENHEEEEEDEDEERVNKIWFYGIIIAGFATGFWAVIGAMVVKIKWRQAYFRYIELVMAKMLGY